MSLFGIFHVLLTCDKKLANSIAAIICSDVSSVELVTQEIIDTKHPRDTIVAYSFRRQKEQVDVGVVVGDPESQTGPYDGECWVFVDAFSFFRRNHKLAREICEILLLHGAHK